MGTPLCYTQRMASYRVQYTEMIPGGSLYRQDESVRGSLEDVRNFIDSKNVWGREPIVITEHLTSDSIGRVVPSSEWDVCE